MLAAVVDLALGVGGVVGGVGLAAALPDLAPMGLALGTAAVEAGLGSTGTAGGGSDLGGVRGAGNPVGATAGFALTAAAGSVAGKVGGSCLAAGFHTIGLLAWLGGRTSAALGGGERGIG